MTVQWILERDAVFTDPARLADRLPGALVVDDLRAVTNWPEVRGPVAAYQPVVKVTRADFGRGFRVARREARAVRAPYEPSSAERINPDDRLLAADGRLLFLGKTGGTPRLFFLPDARRL